MAKEVEVPEKIEIDKTRWKEDAVNFIVKDSVPDKKDTWKVLQTSTSVGVNYSWRKTSGLKYLELSGDEIRKKRAEHSAAIAEQQMTVSGVHLNSMSHKKLLVVRNGKARLSRIHEAMLRAGSRSLVAQS